MKLLDRLLGRREDDRGAERQPCRHLQLAPQWDEASDIGNSSKASAFACASCGERFSPREARELESSVAR